MPIHSAGLLLYRRSQGCLQVFLIHMGGPIWARRDLAAWSIPKGVIEPGESPQEAAVREFREETGFAVAGQYEPLGRFRQNSSKDFSVWALEGDCDPGQLVSMTFSIEWPPRSGKTQSFPEADRGAWYGPEEAVVKIVKGQRPILEAFYGRLAPRDV